MAGSHYTTVSLMFSVILFFIFFLCDTRNKTQTLYNTALDIHVLWFVCMLEKAECFLEKRDVNQLGTYLLKHDLLYKLYHFISHVHPCFIQVINLQDSYIQSNFVLFPTQISNFLVYREVIHWNQSKMDTNGITQLCLEYTGVCFIQIK